MRKGFTLVELLGALVIPGLVASGVAVAVTRMSDRARWSLTVTAVAKLKAKVELFRLHENRLPDRPDERVAAGLVEEVPPPTPGSARSSTGSPAPGAHRSTS
jgi:prepilin-type N-terminal cleavage/methylation domain-containing protein